MPPTQKYKHLIPLHDLVVFAFLLLFSTLIRLPFFFKDVINWDESTYILMGQSILDGHLPYTELWDLKPPIAFFSYAFFIALFGKSIIGIRLAGTLCVTTVAFLNYCIGERDWSRAAGISSSIIFIVAICLFYDGQATMTEIVALVPLMASFYIFSISRKKTTINIFLVSLFLAISLFIRLNLAYVSLVVGLWILIQSIQAMIHRKISWRTALLHQFAYLSGHLVIVLVTLLPYLYAGESRLWWHSVILAPLHFTNASTHESNISLTVSLTTIVGLASLTYAWAFWKKFSKAQRHTYVSTLVFYAATSLSIVAGGIVRTHYLMQILPFTSLLIAVVLTSIRQVRIIYSTLVFISILMAGKSLINGEYRALIGRLINGQPLLTGPAYKIADYIHKNRQLNDQVYMMSHHLVYWLIDAKPISKCVHPSTVSKPYLLTYCCTEDGASPASHMERILASKPKFIVKTLGKEWYLADEELVWQILEDTLQENYRVVEVIEGKQIYQRKDSISSIVLSINKRFQ